MAAVVMPIVNAVCDVLAAVDYGITATVEASLGDWDDAQTHRVQLRIDVLAPTDPPMELLDSAQIRYEVSVDIIIRKRFETTDRAIQNGRLLAEAAEPLVAVVEQVAETCVQDRFAVSDAAWQETTIQTLYEPAHIREYSQFTGHVTVTFWAYKATS